MAESTFITSGVYSQRRLLSSTILSSPSNSLSEEDKEKNILILLDLHYDETNLNYQISLNELFQVANDIYPFSECNACIDFLTDFADPTRKVIFIVNDMFARTVIPLIEDVSLLNAILVFGNYIQQLKEWVKQHPKVKGTASRIHSLIKIVEQIINPDLFPMIDIIGPSNIDPTRLHSSFMYSQLLKEILLDLHGEGVSGRDSFIEYCREHSSDERTIEKFNRSYEDFSPIYWYSTSPFVFETLNRALRTVDVELLLRLIFFIGDLHKEIARLHSNSPQKKPLIVYRGQSLTKNECEKLKASIGGFISFNCFLSTTATQNVSEFYAECNNGTPGCNSVLFEITIDPAISSSSFASIEKYSEFPDENEILFSTHTVFRINGVTVRDNGLHCVDLSLINNHDNDLNELTIHRRKEIEGRTPWHRLAHLLYRMGKFRKAKDIYQKLLGSVSHDEILYINHHLARTHFQMGNFREAISQHAISLQFNDGRNPSLTAAVYAGMGEAFLQEDMLEDSLSMYEKALQIANRSQTVDDHNKVLYLNNIGLVLKLQKQYNEAQDYFQKAIDIALACFPKTHPDLATLYQNIGSLYFDRGDFYTSIDYQKQSLDIQQRSLPPDHPSLGYIHYNLSQSFNALCRTNEAIYHAQLALDILEKTLQNSHPGLRDIRAHLDAISVIQH